MRNHRITAGMMPERGSSRSPGPRRPYRSRISTETPSLARSARIGSAVAKQTPSATMQGMVWSRSAVGAMP